MLPTAGTSSDGKLGDCMHRPVTARSFGGSCNTFEQVIGVSIPTNARFLVNLYIQRKDIILAQKAMQRESLEAA